jgi:hypothetical protein
MPSLTRWGRFAPTGRIFEAVSPTPPCPLFCADHIIIYAALFNGSINLGYKQGGGSGDTPAGDGGDTVSGGGTQTWDNSTQTGFGTSTGRKGSNQAVTSFSTTWGVEAVDTLIPGSGETCPSETNCAVPIANAHAYGAEPFWHDVFALLIHPQFATWEQIAGRRLTVMTGAVPVVGTISVADLSACDRGKRCITGIDPCAVDYSDEQLRAQDGKAVTYHGKSSQVVLTRREAHNLLKLDPFYGHGQGASLDSLRATEYQSWPYGARVGNSPQQQTINVSNATGKEQDTTNTTEYDAAVTSVIGSSTSFGFSLNLAVVGEGWTIGETQTTTEETDTRVAYGDSTAVSAEHTTSTTGILADSDNVHGTDSKFHGPLPRQPSAAVFLDRKFGGFMYVDTAASGPGPGEVDLCPMIVNELLRKEHRKTHFADVPIALADHDAIGVLAAARLLPPARSGVAPDRFQPAKEITRSDFAVMLARAAGLTDGPRESGFVDVPPTDPRSMSIAAVVKQGLMTGETPTTFAPEAVLTQGMMTAALGRAFGEPTTGAGNPDTRVDRAGAARAMLTAIESRP